VIELGIVFFVVSITFNVAGEAEASIFFGVLGFLFGAAHVVGELL
jgi:hypothetical protein